MMIRSPGERETITPQIDPSTIRDRESLADFVDALRGDLPNGVDWENTDLPSFLEAMSAWLRDSHGLERNLDIDLETMPRWQLVAMILSAAQIYE